MFRQTIFSKKKLLVGFLIASLLFGASVNLTQVAAVEIIDYNAASLTGSLTSFQMIGEEWESDADVASVLDPTDTATTFNFEGTDWQITNPVIDLSESNFGKISSDWLGVANDADYPASAGVDYWLLNGTSAPVNEKVAATPTLTTNPTSATVNPANGGHKMTVTHYYPADTDAANEEQLSWWPLDGDISGTDDALTSSSYIYFQVALKIDQDNATDSQSVAGVYVAISDGSTWYYIGIQILNGTSAGFMGVVGSTPADDTWTDYDSFSDTTGAAPHVATGGRFYNEKLAIADNTFYETGLLVNIQDLVNADPESADRISTYYIEGWGFNSRTRFSEGAAAATAEIHNIMVVDDVQDVGLYEQTATTDGTTQQSDNWLNGTSMTLSSGNTDKYPLKDGTVLPLRINRLAFTSAVLEMDGAESWASKDRDALKATRLDIFDTDFGAEEPMSEPSTWYLNISSLSSSRQILQIDIEADTAFQSDGDLESSWSISDKDGSPSINDRGDIYTNFNDIDGDLQVTPKTAIPDSNSIQVKITSEYLVTDFETISPIGFFAALVRDTGNWFNSLPDWIRWLVTIGLIVVIVLVVLALVTRSRLEKKILGKNIGK